MAVASRLGALDDHYMAILILFCGLLLGRLRYSDTNMSFCLRHLGDLDRARRVCVGRAGRRVGTK